jgi:hypothetical protein
MGQQAPPPSAYHPDVQHQGMAMPHVMHQGYNAFQAIQVPTLL